jgi:DNA (cytosine-5)-methyltransferase 1
MGLSQAGFDVIGIDINPDLNYPFPWVVADAMPILAHMAREGVGALREYGLDPDGIDLIWASPPCQSFSAYRRKDPNRVGARAKDLIAEVRRHLQAIGLPYIIENVEAAPLRNAIRLCGSSFKLDVRRHRLFECSFPVEAPPCDHAWHKARGKRYPGATNRPTGRYTCEIGVYRIPLETQREVMGIDWMTLSELSQAIPPAYSKYLAEQFRKAATERTEDMGQTEIKLNRVCAESLKIYAAGIMQACEEAGGVDPIELLTETDRFPQIVKALETVEFICGWFAGVAEAHGVHVEALWEMVPEPETPAPKPRKKAKSPAKKKAKPRSKPRAKKEKAPAKTPAAPPVPPEPEMSDAEAARLEAEAQATLAKLRARRAA